MKNQLISNNLCAEVPGTNGDVYSGTFTSVYGKMQYMYTISFEQGTQARGHKVKAFKIYLMDKGELVEPKENKKDEDTIKEVLQEILLGF